ncbi:MAG: hypothetical protein IT371_00725 [Deltaproteobacteria bacterium]|nr:hypothetical protein [Deltaproteobacteria bacterium]
MPARTVLGTILLGGLMLGAGGCDSSRDWDCRVAVRALVNAKGAGEERNALEKVLTFGPYALTEIEQELHAAPAEARSRLLEALARIGSRDALPLARFVSYWDQEPTIRRQAAEVAKRLARQ